MSNKLTDKAETTTQPTHLISVVGGALKRLTWAGFTALLGATYAASTHAARHKSGGADALGLDELAAPTDVTTLDATTSLHGLLPKLDKQKLDAIESAADVTDAGNVGAAIHGATAKATPVDADALPLIDSAASNVLKRVTWANVKATLKTYLDTLYAAVIHTHALSGLTQSAATSGQVAAWNGTAWAPATASGGGGATITTPRVLHVTTAGHDTTGNGSVGTPYLTAQKAFDIAVAGSGNYLLQFGIGAFGNITAAGGWPLRITLGGVSQLGSRIGEVNIAAGTGGDIRGNGLISVDVISANGDPGVMGTAGDDADPEDPNGSGGGGGNGTDGGAGGYLRLERVYVFTVVCVGGAGGTGGTGGAGGYNGTGGQGGYGGSGGGPGVVFVLHAQVRYLHGPGGPGGVGGEGGGGMTGGETGGNGDDAIGCAITSYHSQIETPVGESLDYFDSAFSSTGNIAGSVTQLDYNAYVWHMPTS